MKIAFAILGLLTFTFLVSCAQKEQKEWEFPYPPAPEAKNVSSKKSYTKGISRIKYDAVEVDPKYKHIFAKIDQEVDDAVKTHPNYGKRGFAKITAETKRRILYWKHNIDWSSYIDLNPNIHFD